MQLFPLDLLDDISLQILRLLGAGPAPLNLAVLAHKELLKVPLHPLQAHEAGLFVLEPFERRVCFVAVDLQIPILALFVSV